MFEATTEIVASDRITKYHLHHGDTILTYSEVLDLWCSDAEFRNFFVKLLTNSFYGGFRWETPALSRLTVSNPFEFVLLNSPEFCSRPTDVNTFGGYFTDKHDADYGIVKLANLGGDATLIIPSPMTGPDTYGHLASFIRHAPDAQIDAFWRVVGTTVKSKVGDHPIWVRTSCSRH